MATNIITQLGKIGLGIAVAGGAIAAINYDLNQALSVSSNNFFAAQVNTVYPGDLPNQNKVAAMIFQFYQYRRPSILDNPTLSSLGSVTLPLPSELIDLLTEDYAPANSGPVLGAALDTLGKSNTQLTIGNVFDNIKSLGSAIGQGSPFAIADNLGATNLTNKALQLVGVAQNPFLSILFNAPTFKRYVFSWIFNPENANDSATLNYILKKLRYHAMPGYNSSGAGILLNYPDMCVPTILPSGYMFDFKKCVIESVSINYAPGDTPAFFNSTMAPTSIKLIISLLEIEFWLKPDMDTFQLPGAGSTITGFNNQAVVSNFNG